MMRFKRLTAFAAIVAAMLLTTACERKITRVETNTQPLTCTECHVDNNLITGKEYEWAQSVHGTGTSFEEEGGNASCAACHSGNAFQEAIAQGLAPDELTQGDSDPTRQDCRACHKIHETYTMQDFALRTTSAVHLYAVSGTTYNGGEGNLCVNCHQPRRSFPAAVNDSISGISTHWGPHHGPQSSMLLGVAGAGVTGSPSGHYGGVSNTCVHCHLGDSADHHFEPSVSTCQTCHPGATNFDIDGVQTEIEDLSNQLGAALLAAGLINENSPDGHPTVTKTQQDKAVALWNWLYVAHEDKSIGVHNADYARDLLLEGLSRLGVTPTAPPIARAGTGPQR
jgi:hypothetical protein